MVGDKAAIAVLGPSTVKGNERASTTAEAVAAELGRLGYVVIAVGDGVTAHGAARGARATGGQVQLVCWPGADSLVESGTEPDRQEDGLRGLARVLEIADAIVLLPGGLESATVLLQMWVFGLSPSAPYRQTVLLGDEWTRSVATMADVLGLDPRARAMVTFAREPKEAVEALRYYVSPLQGLPR